MPSGVEHLGGITDCVHLSATLSEIFPCCLKHPKLGRAIVTTRAQSHIAMETIRDRRLVTKACYLKANLMAMNRSEFIKVRWRTMTERRNKVTVPPTLPIRRGFPQLYLRHNRMTSRIKGIASKPSAIDKLTRMLLEAVRRFRNLWNALSTKCNYN